jgi:hypothetical protein
MSAPLASGVAPHYIRIKRHKLTIFLHCDLQNDIVQAIKERIEKLTGRPWAQIRLVLGKQVLENHSTLYDCGIENEDGELNLVYSLGNDEWEELDDALNGAMEAPGPEPGK